MQTSAPVSKLNHWDVALLGAAAATLITATCVVSGKRPLWYDEIYSRTLILDPSFRHMMHALRVGAESPPGLYHVLARAWVAIAGHSVLALRLFSTLLTVLAIIAIWRTLRRAFSLQATAVGVLTVFCTSEMMLYHSAEARFYPLFVATVALAIAAYANAIDSQRLTVRLAAALVVTNLLLVQAHIYGVAYSAALLFALVCCDVAFRRFRPLVYVCVAATWLSLLPWLPTLRIVDAQTKPRHWIEPPTLTGIVEFYRLYSLELPMILFAVALLCVIGRIVAAYTNGDRKARITALAVLLCLVIAAVTAQNYPGMLDIALLGLVIALAAHGSPPAHIPSDRLRPALLAAAAVLLCAPPAAGIFSVLVKPVFVPKYVLPSMLGISILLTWMVDRGSRFLLTDSRRVILSACWAGLLGGMLLMPLLEAIRESPDQPPQYGIRTSDVEAVIPDGMPVAVESYYIFLPLRQSTKRADKPYYYVGDADAEADPRADRSALLHYRGAMLWKQLGYLPDHAPEWREFLATHDSFAVLHSPGYFWFQWRVRDDPDYTWRAGGKVGEHQVFFVQRRNLSSHK